MGPVGYNHNDRAVGQEFTTGPNSDGFFLNSVSTKVNNFSDNVDGMVVTGAIYISTDAPRGRGELVAKLTHSAQIRKGSKWEFTPHSSNDPIALLPDQRYMFVLECVSNCDDDRWIEIDTTWYDYNNDHNLAALGGCQPANNSCLGELPNPSGWSTEDFYVRKTDNWRWSNGYQLDSLLFEAVGRYRYLPAAPTNLTAVPDSTAPGKVFLTWNSPTPPQNAEAITSHRYRYKLSGTDRWGNWKPIAFSGAGEVSANQQVITGLPNGVPLDFQVQALNGDGGNHLTDDDVVTTELGAGFGICDRTRAVRDAIVAKVSAADDCAAVTTAHLNALTGSFAVNNTLTTLQAGDFDDLTSLTALDLSNNSLSELPPDIFDDLTSLTSLNLSHNNLSEIPPAVFDDTASLTSLNLSHNNLSELPAGIFYELTALQSLNLDHNQLDGLKDGVFDRLTALLSLRLEGNNLSELPADIFDENTALQSLNLNHNQLDGLNENVFDRLTALLSLRLEGNNLSELPADIFDENTALQLLNLNHNQLDGLNENVFDRLTALLELRLGGNNLDYDDLTSDTFAELSSLTLLDLSENSLTALQDGIFSGLGNLRVLYLGGNSTDPMVLDVSMETNDQSQVRAVIPTGAPFFALLFATVTDGTFESNGGADEVFVIPVSGRESQWVTVTSIRPDQDPLVEISNLPTLPALHFGYVLKVPDGQTTKAQYTHTLGIADAIGYEDEDIEFTISLDQAAQEEVTVKYTTSVENGQTATPGTDFTAVTASTATISAGSTSVTVPITVDDDTLEEPDETFTVTLTEPSFNARLGENSSAAGTILDNDGELPVVTIAAASADESAGSIDFTVTMSEAVMSSKVWFKTVTSVASGQTATSGTDFRHFNNKVQSFERSETTKTVSIPIFNDMSEESDETFTVTLTVNSTNRARPGPAHLTSAVGTILDDDDTTATVDGTSLVITFNEDLAAAPNLANEAFEVKKTPAVGSEETVTLSGSPSISGATVTLTLSNAVAHDDTVTVKYTRPSTDDNNRLEDADGNEVETFTEDVTNNTPDTAAPAFDKAEVNGTLLLITFDEDLAAASNLADSAFEVKKTPLGGNEETVTLSGFPSINGKTVRLTLSGAVAHGDAVTVNYTKPATDDNNRLEDAAGNEVETFDAPKDVTNHTGETTAPSFSSATVDEAALVMTFDEDLAAAPNLANDAFEVKKTPSGGSEETVTLSGSPSISGATVTLTLSNAVAHDDAVTVRYTMPTAGSNNRLKDAAGNEAADFPIAASVANITNARASGRPAITGTAQEGETLTADTSGIVDGDGKTKADNGDTDHAYSYQWVRVDEDGTSNPTDIGSDQDSYLLVAGDVGKKIRVQVSYTDDAGNDEGPLESDATGTVTEADTTAPSFSSATVDEAALVLTFDEDLAAAPNLANDAFEVKKTPSGGSEETVTLSGSPSISGATVTLTLSNAVESSDRDVTVKYTKPSTDNNNRLEDAAGNEVDTFTGDVDNITGNSAATGQPAITGTPRVDETLTADTGGIMDENGNFRAENGHTGYAYSYQWFRVDSDGVSNSTSIGSDQSTYQLAAADAGRKIRVQVSFTDNAGYAEGPLASDAYPLFGTVRGGNATGAPAISGTAQEGETLTADTSGIMDIDGKTKADNGDTGYAYSYQWFRVDSDGVSNSTAIGSDQSTYQLVAADAGRKIRVQVEFKDNAGNAEGPLDSDAYPQFGAVQGGNATGAPAITGTVQVGETLEADTSGITDADGNTKAENGDAGYAYSYQWLRVDSDGVSNPVEVGSDQDSYLLVAADTGKKIGVQVEFTDDADNAEGPLVSAASGPVAAPTLTASFDPMEQTVIEGETTEVVLRIVVSKQPEEVVYYRAQTHSGTADVIDDFTPSVPPRSEEAPTSEFTAQDDGSYTYERTFDFSAVADTDVEGDEVFYVGIVDLGMSLNDHYDVNIVGNEDGHGALIRIREPATGAPAITGTAQEGETLTADTSGIVDGDGKTKADNGDADHAYSYQWVRVDSDGVSNPTDIGSDQDSYLLVAADVGKKIKVQVSYTDDAGNDEGPLESDAVPAEGGILGGNEPAVGTPEIDGKAQVGQQLMADTSNIEDPNGLEDVSYDYQWFRMDSDGVSNHEMVGSNQETYMLEMGDAGKKIGVQVKFKDDAGNDEGPLESPTYPSFGTVKAGNATGRPTITGLPRVGETLTADTGGIMDANGKTKADNGDTGYAYSYQWFRVDSDGVSNATGIGSDQSTYQLVMADMGKKIGVQVSYTDDAGNAEGPLDSDAYPFFGTVRSGNATGQPAISGTAQVNETLTAGTSGIADINGKTKAENGDAGYAYSYQWFRVDSDGASNATSIGSDQSTYQLVTADVGKKIRVRVSYTDDAGNAEGPLDSDAYPEAGTVTGADTTAPALDGNPAVDGVTLVLTFDEALAAASGLANSAFTVKVGGSSVGLGGSPTLSGATLTLTLSAAVAPGDTVTVSYDKPTPDNNNRLEDASGNEVASFSDQAVDNNTADTTAPVFDAAAVDGSTLVITFDESLAAASSLANSAFTVKVGGSSVGLGGSPAISGATVTLTLSAAVVPGDTVTVSYDKPTPDNNNRLEDASGNEVASFSDQAVDNNTADTTAPALDGNPTVDGVTLVLTFDEALAAASGLANSAFTVKVGGSSVGLGGSPTLSGATVTLTLVSAVVPGDTVTVSYDKPTPDSNNRLEDASGNEVASFSDQAVDNNTADTTAPVFDEAAVDGSTLVITFDESLAAASNLANGAFRVKVDGTRVDLSSSIPPSLSGATVTLALSAAVAPDDTVTVRYVKPTTGTGNKLQDASGNEVRTFPFQAVTNNTADTTAPALDGNPAVDGVTLVLTFDEALAAASGLANSAFTVKVSGSSVGLGGSPAISGATVTLTLSAAVAPGDTVTVSYDKPTPDNNNRLEDASGNEVASFSDQAVDNNTADTTAPVFDAAAVDGSTLVITFDESLAAASSLANSAFTVKVGGSSVGLGGSPTLSGATLTLTLSAAVAPGDTVTVSYDKPTSGSNNTLADASGNEVASFSDQAVDNNTADTTAPVFDAAAVDGSTLVITFDESLAAASGLANSAFTVKVGGSSVGLGGSPTLSGATLTLTLSAAVAPGDTVTVSYDKPTSGSNNTLADASGNEVASFSDQAVDNNTADTTAPALDGNPTVDGSTLVIAFDESLAAASNLANSAFKVKVDDSDRGLSGTPSISGATVTLTLASAVAHDDTVTVRYVKPTTGTGNKLQDASGNEVATFTFKTVTNNTEDTTIPGDGCTEGTQRLRNGNTANEGRLEICALHPDRGTVWGTVCDDYWTDEEAGIACRAMGYAGAEARGGQFLRSHFGWEPGDPPILLDDLICTGDETSLLDCPVSRGAMARNYVGEHNCGERSETVGVRCLVEPGDEQHMAGLRAFDSVPPPRLSVADAEVQEGAGARLDFVVALDRAAAQAVTVDYASADGTATAGEDYVAVRGTLKFAAGETEQTIRVTVLDDSHNEGSETLRLLLSAASGADLADREALGTIINSDPLPKGWLARFGRTSAVQVLGLLDNRFDEVGAAASQLTLGGHRIRLPARQSEGERQGPATPEAGGQDGEDTDSIDRPSTSGDITRRPARHARINPGTENDTAVLAADGYGPPSARPDNGVTELDGTTATGARQPNLLERAAWKLLTQRGSLWAVDRRRFLSQSSFDLSLSDLYQGAGEETAESAGPALMQPDGRWSLWGRGALTHFAGRDREVQIEGDVLTGVLGLDYRTARWLTGVALSWSDGDGRYRSAIDSGALDSHLAGVYPYGRYALTDRLSVWGVLGYGRGGMRLQQAAEGEDTREAVKTGIGMGMGAAGLRGIVYSSEAGELAVKSDALWVRTRSDATDGMAGVAAADASRVRLLLSGVHRHTLWNGGLLTPDVELGLRYDGGAVETGFGMELGAGLRYADPMLGLMLETRARGLIAHEDDSYEEWGLSGSVQLDPGRAGRGLMLRLASGWGMTESGTRALWERQGRMGPGLQPGGEMGSRFSAEWSYGLDVPWRLGVLTPYGGVDMAGRGRRLRLGWRYELGQSLSLSLDGERRETSHARPQHGLMLRTSLPW